TAMLFLVLTSAFSPLSSNLYLELAKYIPFMIAFRESAQWSFFVILSYSLLIGFTFSTLYHRVRNKVLQVFVLSLAIMIFFSSSYPLMTGDVARNWLNSNVKGYFFPDSYVKLNTMLSNQYWTLLLPQRYTYVSYNFSGVPLNSGNPYPLIFSKPVISGLGTEYVQSENLDLLNRVYGLMLTNGYRNVAPEGKASASSVEKEGLIPTRAIDGDNNTRWASEKGMPQWFEIEWSYARELTKIRIVFEAAYANDYAIETWNGSNWATQIEVENNTSLENEYVFSRSIPATKLRIEFTKALRFNQTSIWELEVFAQNGGLSRFLGTLGIKHFVLEKDFMSGAAYDISQLKFNENDNFVLIKEWDEISLYNNTNALQKISIADNILSYTTLDDMFQTVQESTWETLQHSVLLNATSPNTIGNNALVSPENFVWRELSPTGYEVHVESKGSFVLVLLESYDEHWKVSVNGNQIKEKNHQEANAFANCWLIDQTGDLTISIQYETQSLFLLSAVASLALPALLLAFLNRKDLKKISNLIRSKLKFIKAKLKQKMRMRQQTTG
ncbi:MAG: discoidin domain-containing protein, partial [Candidatus Thorarchaeota archaeon]|nr:discoidin domain-containing protein [Candidatus Thorarchaeota archaeon]